MVRTLPVCRFPGPKTCCSLRCIAPTQAVTPSIASEPPTVQNKLIPHVHSSAYNCRDSVNHRQPRTTNHDQRPRYVLHRLTANTDTTYYTGEDPGNISLLFSTIC